ncbi:MAG: cellulase family glycosylhydrolase [Terrimicrobiaceae bacterium]
MPIGLNLAWPQYYRLPRGGEFLTLDEYGTMGCKDYGRWFSKLQAAGANFARVWLSHPYLNPENDSCPKVMLTSSGVAYPYLDSKHDGELDLEKLKRLDEVVDLARKHGIYLMLCLEHFRHIHCQDGEALSRPRWNSMKGGAPENMDEWFQQPLWQDLWFQKVNAVTARYGNDPIIMAWELWNEIDCCETSSWNVQQEWTAATLAKIKFLCPKNLVTNSLGSFDTEEKIAFQNDFKMEEMDFQQVHRYLDQGSRLPICSNPVELGIDAIKKSSRHNRPIILSETGGVNDSHTGPFRFYRADDDGLIFHDVTYPAFFAGSAGSGHIWHWEEYVDQKNLWHGYKALSDLLQDVQPDREKYEALELSTPEAWVYVLSGRSSLLGWVRNRKDTWQNVLRDGKISAPVEGLNLDVSTLKLGDSQQPIELFRPWPADASGQPKQVGHNILFPDFTHGFLFRILRA